MGLVHKFRDYILDTELKVTMLKNCVNVVNYNEIGHFDANKIVIYYDQGSIIVNGNNLVISKLLIDEILITGNIKNIEFR